jgi:hypothetical protein
MAKISARGAYALAKWSKPSTIEGSAMLALRSDGAILERLYSGGAYRHVARYRPLADAPRGILSLADRLELHERAIARADRYATAHGYSRI